MLTVHHLAVSQSERIVWLCEELGLPYELVRYEREATGRAPAEFRALHPFATAPVITDGDLVLGESGAIVEYIIRRYADDRLILGPDHPDFAPYLYWFHFANGSFLPAIMLDRMAAPTPEPVSGAPASRLDRALQLIEARLGESAYLAGEVFTAADVMMCLPRFLSTRDLTPYPNTKAYMQRVGERPAHRRAVEKAEPDSPAH